MSSKVTLGITANFFWGKLPEPYLNDESKES